MKISLVIALLLALSGCATQHMAASQNYRLKGDDSAISIEGKVNQSALGNENSAEITFNGEMQILVPLNYKYFGEATGKPFKGKQTSATCTAERKSSYSIDVRCMVFVDNERTVTLTF